jgi:lysophospholipase L1-like esterase
LARNLDLDFPEWHGRDLGDASWHSLATDGATTATVLGVQLPRLGRLPRKPSLVTLTIGGNDVLGCYGDTGAALRTVGAVGERVAETLQRLHALTQPSAHVVVGTVYDPSDATGDAGRVGLPPWPEVVEVLATLNRTLRSVAEEHGAAVAEIHDRFLGHGLTAGDPAQADARPADRDLWYSNIIEPNAWGASAVRAAFWEALQPGSGSPR